MDPKTRVTNHLATLAGRFIGSLLVHQTYSIPTYSEANFTMFILCHSFVSQMKTITVIS